MKQFIFLLTREETIEHLYEYIISRSCDFFGVPNLGTTYSIIVSDDSFIMYVYLDEDKTLTDSLDIDGLAYTDSSYKKLFLIPPQYNTLHLCNGHACLNRGEVRYVKFDHEKLLNEIGLMFYVMANDCLKLKTHEAELSYNLADNTFSYKGFFEKGKYGCKTSRVIDITERMRKCWY